jgi:hypothetical protein
MRDENIHVANIVVFDEFDTKRPQAGPSVENEYPLATANFDAWRIAAISNCRGSRARNAASDTPEPHPHRMFLHQNDPDKSCRTFYLEWATMSSQRLR